MFPFGPKVPTISAEDVKKAIDDKRDIVLLDVRTPQEYAKGKIANSINVPVDVVRDKIAQVIPDKEKTVYVYCLSGSRSMMAADALLKLGYKQVYSMTSGLLAWRAKQYPVI